MMPALFTLFNRNDPTPTARSLRNVEWDSASVIILGLEGFSSKHTDNLRRFVSWITGTARNYPADDKDEWPSSLWQSEWDWTPLTEGKLSFVQGGEVDEHLLKGLKDGDYVDITSGSKAQAGALVKAVKLKGIDATFLLQTRSGETLNLSTGDLTSNASADLTLRENIWLSGGYLASFGVQGEREKGKIWIDSTKSKEKGKTRPDAEQVSKELGLDKTIDLSKGFWLEDASVHSLSTWPSISEAFVGVRLIKPRFSEAAGAAHYTLLLTPWKKRKFDPRFMNWWQDKEQLTPKENAEARRAFYDEWVNYLRDEDMSHSLQQIFVKSAHSVEFDFIAKDSNSMSVITGECKDKEKVSKGEVGRIHSLSKMVFPTAGLPLMVFSGKGSGLVNGVHTLSWPDLSDCKVIENITKNGTSLTFTKDQQNSETVKKPKVRVNPNEEQKNVLKECLHLVKSEPQSYTPQFMILLRKAKFGTTKGLLNWLEKNLADEMGFTLHRKLLNTPQWISWNDAIPSVKRNETNPHGKSIMELLERIVELLEKNES